MSILSKLQSLLTAANTTTGESDTTLTDAIQTLVDGYGQGGGGSIGVITGSVTGNGTHTISFACTHTPVAIFIYREDIDSIVAIEGERVNDVTVFGAGMCLSYYSLANATNMSSSGVHIGATVDSTIPTEYNSIGLVDGNLYIRSGNNQNLWSTSLTYNYVIYYNI